MILKRALIVVGRAAELPPAFELQMACYIRKHLKLHCGFKQGNWPGNEWPCPRKSGSVLEVLTHTHTAQLNGHSKGVVVHYQKCTGCLDD